jgi:hypothetical protein
VATDTIDYVATDGAGLTSTSTRTVIIEPAVWPPPSPRWPALPPQPISDVNFLAPFGDHAFARAIPPFLSGATPAESCDLACSGPHDMDGVADHFGGAALTFGRGAIGIVRLSREAIVETSTQWRFQEWHAAP